MAHIQEGRCTCGKNCSNGSLKRFSMPQSIRRRNEIVRREVVECNSGMERLQEDKQQYLT